MKRIIGILLTVFSCLWLVGCGGQEDASENTIQVYYVNNNETKVEVHGYSMQSKGNVDEELQELLTCLGTNPEKLEYKAPLAMGFELLSAEYTDGRLILDVSEDYQRLPFTTEVLVT